MKKLSIYLGIIIGLFVLLFGINQYQMSGQNDNMYGVPASKLNQLTRDQLTNPNYQNIILPADLKKQLQNKEPSFVYFYSPDCPHCMKTTPVLYPLSKSMNVDMKQFNLMEFKEGWSTYKITATPTLVYYKDGKEVERLVGEQPEAKFKEFFSKHK